MTRLAASVASFARSVEWAAVRSSAVTRDVAELATGVALHSLSLAVSCEVVRSTALVTSGWTRATSKAAPKASIATTSRSSSASHSSGGTGVRAVASQVAGETTTVAASAGAGSAQA